MKVTHRVNDQVYFHPSSPFLRTGRYKVKALELWEVKCTAIVRNHTLVDFPLSMMVKLMMQLWTLRVPSQKFLPQKSCYALRAFSQNSSHFTTPNALLEVGKKVACNEKSGYSWRRTVVWYIADLLLSFLQHGHHYWSRRRWWALQ